MKFSSTQLVAILLATGAQAQNNDLGNIINGAASIINGIGPGVQSALTAVGGALNPNQPTPSGTPTVVNTPTATGGAETSASGSASSGQASSSQGASATPGASGSSGSVKPTGSAKSSTTSAPSGNSAGSLSAPNQYMVVAGAAIAAFGTYFV
jgi:cobalamin biosynthesis Mg chelatase CobN